MGPGSLSTVAKEAEDIRLMLCTSEDDTESSSSNCRRCALGADGSHFMCGWSKLHLNLTRWPPPVKEETLSHLSRGTRTARLQNAITKKEASGWVFDHLRGADLKIAITLD